MEVELSVISERLNIPIRQDIAKVDRSVCCKRLYLWRMMEVIFTTRKVVPGFIQIKVSMAGFGFYQNGSMDRLVLVYLVCIATAVTDINFAKKHTPGTLPQHPKGST